MDETGIISD